MNNVISVIAHCSILYVGILIFPNNIIIINWQDAVMVTLIWWGAVSVCNLISAILISIGTITNKIALAITMLILTIILFAVSTFLGLYISTQVIENFALNGFWTWVVIAILSILFSSNPSTNRKEK